MNLEELEQLKKKLNEMQLEKAKLDGKKEEILKRLKEEGIDDIKQLEEKINSLKEELSNLKNRKEKIEGEIKNLLKDKGL